MRPHHSRPATALSALALMTLLACESVSVRPVAVMRVEVVPGEATILVGDTVLLEAVLSGASGTLLHGRTIDWSSANPSVAPVDAGGTVTGLVPGSTFVRATVEGMTGTANVVVESTSSFSLDRTAVHFVAQVGGATSGPEAVLVTAAAGDPVTGLTSSIAYGVGQPTGWLVATLSSNSTPAALALAADGGALPSGTYDATVSVSASGAALAEVSVTIDVSPAHPSIGLSRSSVDFSASLAGATPTPETVRIVNLGGGTLTQLSTTVRYASGGPTGWLAASLSTGTAPADLVLTATAATLGPGTYSASVDIASPAADNSPQVVTVSLTVAATAPPRLGLSAGSVRFGATLPGPDPSPERVSIDNLGSGTLDGLTATVQYSGGQPSGWLTTSLSSTSAPATLTLVASIGSLQPGTYTANVVLAAAVASNSPVTVAVTFEVVPPGPVIALSRSTVSFAAALGGGDPPTQGVQVTSANGATLTGLSASISYESGPSNGWLSASLNSTSAPATLSLAASTSALAPGSYAGTVQISAPSATNSPQSVSVVLQVTAAQIELSSGTVHLSAASGAPTPVTRSISITSGGSGSLTGLTASVTYASGSGWLTAVLAGGTAPTTLTLTGSAGALQAGTYRATVRISSPVASNSPQEVAVTFAVGQPPNLGLSTTSVGLSAQSGSSTPTSRDVSIVNAGGGTISGLSTSIQYSDGSGWLQAALTDSRAPSTLTLTANAGSLAPGRYAATVAVSSPDAANSPQDVVVTFTVTAPPSIQLSRSTIDFSAQQGGGDPSPETVDVSNSGGGVLDGLSTSVSYGGGPSGWLTALLSSTSAPAAITVRAAIGSLPAGTHTASIRVSSTAGGVTNSPRTIAVTIVVTPPPSIRLSRSTVDFTSQQGGDDPGPETVDVTNSGGGVLDGLSTSVSYGSGPTGWLVATLSSSRAPATLTLRAQLGSLVAGTYNATVRVASTANGVTNSPRSVDVTFAVTPPPPEIELSRSNLSFSRAEGTGNPAARTVDVTNAGGLALTGLTTSIQYGGGGAGWLSATLSSSTAPATISVRATMGSLKQGTYGATVSVHSPVAVNSPQTFVVTFNVTAPPTIAITPSSRSFTTNEGGLDPAARTVAISNSGTGALDRLSVGSIQYGGSASGWLAAQLASSIAPTTLRLAPAVGGLSAGVYTARVEVRSQAAGVSNSPQFVDVRFDVTPRPTIVIDKGTALITVLEGQTAVDRVQITEASGNPMPGLTTAITYTGGGATGWLVASLAATQAPTTLTLTGDGAGRSPGVYTADVRIFAPGGTNSPRDVQVTLEVLPGPTIGLSDLSKAFSAPLGGATPAEQTIAVTNTGGGALTGLSRTINYTGGPNGTGGWLNASLDGSNAPTTLRLTVNPSRSGLVKGTYTAVVRVRSTVASNSPQSVTVTFTVN